MMLIRQVKESDYDQLISVIDDWWGGRAVRAMLPRLFFQHFRETSFVAVEGGKIVGFLVGFVSPSSPVTAYAHFIGVSPKHRQQGIGNALYGQFFDIVQTKGCRYVKCVTSPTNSTSIAFHRRMGFGIEAAGSIMADIPFQSNYDGPGQDRVMFTRDLPLRCGSNQESNVNPVSDQVAAQVTLIGRFYHEMWNRFDKTVIPELLSTDIRFRGSLGQSKVGHEQFGEYVDFIRAAFPDFTNRIETIVSEAGVSFARLSYSGTHAGELFGVPATGKQLEYAGVALFQFRDGLIAEVWVLGDIHGLLQQIHETPDRD